MKKSQELKVKFNLFFIIVLSSAMLTSCSKSGGGGGNGVPGTKSEPIETELFGTYQAVFAPINTKVSGHLNGSLTIVRERDEVVVDVRLSNGPASTLHTQTIHMDGRCPTEADDLNLDGYVDGEEAAKVTGNVLIPLDDDISSQRMGLGTYPATDIYGYYFWSRTTPFEKLMEDLREEDINPTDEYAKLGNEKSLTMINRIVVIRGVPDTTPLPETALGFGRMTKFQALPVACGVIKRQGRVSGEIDKDNTGIPVPAGETIGGSSGADDGANFPPTPTTPTTGGDYGDDEGEEDGEVITRSNEVNPGSSGGGRPGN
jgi:hypothetical protein